MITGFYLVHHGKTYDLLDANAKAIDVKESDALILRVMSSVYEMPSVNIGDYTLPLTRQPTNFSGNGHLFESKESNLFKNFIGVSHIELSQADDDKIISSPPINVFALKMTYDKAASFLRYIVNNEDVSSACFSLTHGKSDNGDSTESIMTKINLGMKVLNHLKNEWARFEKDPCTKREVQQSLEKYDRRMHLDDQSIAYLSSHPDELSLSASNQADIRLSGRLYSIGNIVTNEGVLNKDVYENQVILSFLHVFMSFLKSVKNKSIETNNANHGEHVSADGTSFVSIDKLLKDSGLIFDYSKLKVELGIELCQKYIRVLHEKFGCKITTSKAYKPVPTHKVLHKPHYLNAFKLIRNYHAAGEPLWTGMSDSYGLRSLPKIYEFVVLVGLINSITRLGFNREKSEYLSSINASEPIRKPINEINNYHVFSNADGVKIKLFYDLAMRPLADLSPKEMNGSPVDIKGYMPAYMRRPDYYLLIEKNEDYEAHILDAKYSTMDNVSKFLLPECAMKYGFEARTLSIENNEMRLRMVDSVTIACSEYGSSYQSIIQRSTKGLRQEIKNLCPIKPEVGYLGIDEGSEHILMGFVSSLLGTASFA
jgi:hypothetical protein